MFVVKNRPGCGDWWVGIVVRRGGLLAGVGMRRSYRVEKETIDVCVFFVRHQIRMYQNDTK